MSTLPKVDGKTALPVHLLDNSKKTILIDDNTTVEVAIRELLEKIGVAEIDRYWTCFSLHECKDGVTIERALSNSTVLQKLFDRWTASSKLVFQVKLFMQSIRFSQDHRVIYLQYIQGVYNVICGVYPTSMDEAVSLAALQVQVKFGDHDPRIHKPGYLDRHLKGLIPASLLPYKSPSTWQEEIFARHAMMDVDTRANPTLSYVRMLQARDYYGCAFFVVEQSFSKALPKHILLGISSEGIFVMDPMQKITIERYTLPEIFRWGFKPGVNFYFEIKTPSKGTGPHYVFETTIGNVISDLLSDYANQLLVEIKEMKTAQQEAERKAEMEAARAASEALVQNNRQKAATRMAAMYRGYRVRRDLTCDYAVKKIQAVTRGFLARCKFDKMLEALEAEISGQDGAPGVHAEHTAAAHDASEQDETAQDELAYGEEEYAEGYYDEEGNFITEGGYYDPEGNFFGTG